MSKKSLRSEQVKMIASAEDFVEEAATKASWMVLRDVRGPGDLLPAMGRIENRYGVPYSVLWALRYKRPKSIAADIFARICVAYEVERERQRKLLEEQADDAQPTTRFGRAVIRKDRDLVRQKVGTVERESK